MIINPGVAANDGTGDPLRDAMIKINSNQAAISQSISAEPGSPASGDLYIVPTGATGTDWASEDGNVAWYNGTAWEFYTPEEGWRFWVNDENAIYVYDGAVWTLFSSGGGASTSAVAIPTGWELKETITTTGGTTIDIDADGLDEILIVGEYSLSSAGIGELQFSTDGGSTVLDGGTDYTQIVVRDATPVGGDTDGFELAQSASIGDQQFVALVEGMLAANTKTAINLDAATGTTETVRRTGYANAAATHNAVRITASAGTFDVMDVQVWRKTASLGVLDFSGFRATTSATQAVPLDTQTRILFGTEVFDSDGNFASNVFTVPATLAGKYMVFTGGLQLTSAVTGTLFIRRDPGGGFVNVAAIDFATADNITISSGPILLTAGDVIELSYFGAAVTVSDDDISFFSGAVVGGQVGVRTATENAESSSSYIAVAADFDGNKVRRMNSGSALNVTINSGLGATEPWTVIQKGSGQVTFVAGGGVTINAPGGGLFLSGQFSAAVLMPDPAAADTFDLIGDTTT